MKPLHRLPLDSWFDDVPHPYDTWPVATEKTPTERLHDDMRSAYENPRPEEEIADDISMHEKMYRLAVQKHSPWKGGGSENFCHGGGSEEWQDSKPG